MSDVIDRFKARLKMERARLGSSETKAPEPVQVAADAHVSPQSIYHAVFSTHFDTQIMTDTAMGAMIDWGDQRASLSLVLTPENLYRDYLKEYVKKKKDLLPAIKKKSGNDNDDEMLNEVGVVPAEKITDILDFNERWPEISHHYNLVRETSMRRGFDVQSGDGENVSYFSESVVHDALGLYLQSANMWLQLIGVVVLAVPEDTVKWVSERADAVQGFDDWLSERERKETNKRRDRKRSAADAGLPSHEGIADWEKLLPMRVVDPRAGTIRILRSKASGNLVYQFEPNKDMLAPTNTRFIVHPSVDPSWRPTADGCLHTPVARACADWKRRIGPLETPLQMFVNSAAQPLLLCDTKLDPRLEAVMTAQEKAEQQGARNAALDHVGAGAAPSENRTYADVFPAPLASAVAGALDTAVIVDAAIGHVVSVDDVVHLKNQLAREQDRINGNIPMMYDTFHPRYMLQHQHILGLPPPDWSAFSLRQFDRAAMGAANQPLRRGDAMHLYKHREAATMPVKQFVEPKFDIGFYERTRDDFRKSLMMHLNAPSAMTTGSAGAASAGGKQKGFTSNTEGDIAEKQLQVPISMMRREYIVLFDRVYREVMGNVLRLGLNRLLFRLRSFSADLLMYSTLRQLQAAVSETPYTAVVSTTDAMANETTNEDTDAAAAKSEDSATTTELFDDTRTLEQFVREVELGLRKEAPTDATDHRMEQYIGAHYRHAMELILLLEAEINQSAHVRLVFHEDLEAASSVK